MAEGEQSAALSKTGAPIVPMGQDPQGRIYGNDPMAKGIDGGQPPLKK